MLFTQTSTALRACTWMADADKKKRGGGRGWCGGKEGKVVTAKQRSESQCSLQARKTNLPSVPSTLVRLNTLFLSYIGSGQWIFFLKKEVLKKEVSRKTS